MCPPSSLLVPVKAVGNRIIHAFISMVSKQCEGGEHPDGEPFGFSSTSARFTCLLWRRILQDSAHSAGGCRLQQKLLAHSQPSQHLQPWWPLAAPFSSTSAFGPFCSLPWYLHMAVFSFGFKQCGAAQVVSLIYRYVCFLIVRTVGQQTWGDRAFSIAVPTFWKSLSKPIRDCRILKTHLFKTAFQHLELSCTAQQLCIV